MMVVIETFWVRTARFPCGQSVNRRKKKILLSYCLHSIVFSVCTVQITVRLLCFCWVICLVPMKVEEYKRK